MSSKLDNLLFHFNQLSEAEQAKFIAAVKTSGKVVTLEDLLRSKRDDGIRCPYCGSTEAVRFGQRNGIQRYRCRGKDCGKMFSDLTGSILSGHEKRLSSLETLREVYDGRAFCEEVSRDL